MRQRTSRRKRQRMRRAVAKGDEPPEPISLSTATLIAAGLGAATAVGTPFISKALAPKAPSQIAPITAPQNSLLSPSENKLKPGQKTNAINTSPQGLLSDASVGRQSLLGG